jgi:NAD(P)-dependent dehydrogenase (short-subunit alcohol dehydrogenase family)
VTLFITGGSRGLGRAIVLHAVATGHGVAFTYRERKDQAAEVVAEARRLNGGCCRAYQLDVRDSTAVERVGDQVLDDFDAVQAVVCNAGITRDGMAATMPDEDWQAVIDTNLTGAFYVARHFLPALIGGGGGRIVFVSSISRNGTSGQVNYAASKAGLIGLSGTLAKEYGRKGITSNVIVPGVFDTDLTRSALSDELRDFWHRFCPSPRAGDLRDVSSLVLFLASDAAAFVNGQVIPVTGGLDWTP